MMGDGSGENWKNECDKLDEKERREEHRRREALRLRWGILFTF